MPIFEFTGSELVELKSTTFSTQGLSERGDLQRVLRDQPHIIAPDVLIVAEEFADWEDSKRRIDLLGVDREGNLVVIELKRTEDGGHMELQAIRYAAMVSKMTFEKVTDVFQRYLTSRKRKDDARTLLLEFLDWEQPEEGRFAQDVRIVLASAEFSKELTSAVLWLNERDVDIRCVRLRPHTDGKRVFIDVQQVLPLPEASEYFVNLREKRQEERQSRRREGVWTGLLFLNVGAEPDAQPAYGDGKLNQRHWENCRRLGYVAAGGAPRYSDPIRKLKIGDEVMAYQKQTGYVGYGVVSQPALPIHEFHLGDGRTLAEVLKQPEFNAARPPEEWEYAVGIEWRKTFPLSEAKTFKGVFANQNIVCKLTNAATLSFVQEQFAIPTSSAEA